MAQFTARMVHPDGPAPFPEDARQDRDHNRDPRSVMVIADTVEEAKATLLNDNPGFTFVTGPTKQE